MILTVAPDGSAQYTTIQAAIDAAPAGGNEPVIIRVCLGEYHEKLHINKSNLRIIGDVVERTVLTFSDHAKQAYPDGTEKGTFLSYTAIITGNHVEIENMTIRNDAGPGDLVGQAVALYAAGDRIALRNCRLIAHQDTLFCGPTMPKVARNALPHALPVQSDSAGDAALSYCRQYYENCTIQGDIDFIFGPYRCWFERCTLICNNRDADINGYYTAANTPIDQPHGFVFHRCKLTGDGCADGTVSLGRPWRAYARTVFLHCEMDACVKPEGWDDWDKPVTWRYAEHGTTGARSDLSARHKNASLLTPAEAEAITMDAVIGGPDGWNPASPRRTVYIAGDSTACDYGPEVYPRTGWGQVLGAVLGSSAFVVNQASSGRSSKSFLCEQRLLHVQHCLRPGDLLLIQFGHNDEKADLERATKPFSTYQDYLMQYIDAARAQGAIPILLTPIVRRAFEDGALMDTHGEYLTAMRALAKTAGVQLIDLEAQTRASVWALGEEASKGWYLHIVPGRPNYPDGVVDDTHLSFDGAYAIAQMVAEALPR